MKITDNCTDVLLEYVRLLNASEAGFACKLAPPPMSKRQSDFCLNICVGGLGLKKGNCIEEAKKRITKELISRGLK